MSNAVGPGLFSEYERLVGPKKQLAWHVSANLDYLETDSKTGILAIVRLYPSAGLRYHVSLSENVTYAVGGSLAIGYSNVHRSISSRNSNENPYKDDAYTALMLDNDIIIQPAGHFVMAIHTATGISFAPITDIPFCFTIGLKFGRRF